MEIEAFLGARSGVARASVLGAAGFTRTSLGKAVAAGTIVRIRRGVYSLPQEAGVFGLALRHNALVTCLSAAPTYRLWTLDEAGPVHLVPGHRCRRRERWPTAGASMSSTRGFPWRAWPTFSFTRCAASPSWKRW
jgi:Transcriptional regulator, AbiEi antitoxin